MTMSRFAAAMFALSGLAGLIAVAAAALAAHALASIAGEGAVDLFRQATSFQMNHALGLIAVTIVAEHCEAGRARMLLRASAVLLAAAMILFPGALYSSSFGGPVFFAPFGGVAAMAGWALFGVGALLTLKRSPAA